MRNTLIFSLLLTLLPTLSFSSIANAEVIEIPVGQQSADHNITLPNRYSDKQTVLSEYGEPLYRSEATGTPPIIRWDYEGFSVYFEYDHVIHAVIKHTAQQ